MYTQCLPSKPCMIHHHVLRSNITLFFTRNLLSVWTYVTVGAHDTVGAAHAGAHVTVSAGRPAGATACSSCHPVKQRAFPGASFSSFEAPGGSLASFDAWIQGLFGALEPGGSGGVVGGSLLWQGCSASGFLRGELSLPQNCCKVQIKKFLKSNLQTNWKSQISFLSALFKRPPRMRWLYYVLCTSHSHMILTRMENMSRMASHIFWGWWCWSSRRGRWWKRGWSTSRSSTRNLLRAIRNVHTSVNTLVCCIEFIVSICRLHKLWAEVKYKWSEFDQHSQLENIHLAELIN